MRPPFVPRPARPLFIGVVHLLATPGAPRYAGPFGVVLDRARADARALADGGVDAVVVENFGDVPFHRETVPPETVAALALAVDAVRSEVGELAVGVNVLRNDARAGLGICAATGASFLRVNVLAGAMTTDQGLIEGRAASLLRERARLVPAVAILADVHVKHATPLGRESLAEAAADTLRRALADVLIVTGSRTGAPPAAEDLARVRERVGEACVLVGSGVEPDTAATWREHTDGAIVGTGLKRDGRIENPVDPERVRRLRSALDG